MSTVKLPHWVLPGSALLFFAACAMLRSPSEHMRGSACAETLSEVPWPDPALTGDWRGSAPPPARVTIYIESDGAPWRLPDEPPADPTPLKPFVIRMAIA